MLNGGFTLTMKPQSIAHFLNGSEHICWILDLEGEMHAIWNLWAKWPSRMQEQCFPKLSGRATIFNRVQKNIILWTGGCPCPILTLRKVCEGEFNVLPIDQCCVDMVIFGIVHLVL